MAEEDRLADAVRAEGCHGAARRERVPSRVDQGVASDEVREVDAGRVHRLRQRLVSDLARDTFERSRVAGREGDREVDRLLPDVGADGDLAVRRGPDVRGDRRVGRRAVGPAAHRRFPGSAATSRHAVARRRLEVGTVAMTCMR
jgi:hypothetical protein